MMIRSAFSKLMGTFWVLTFAICLIFLSPDPIHAQTHNSCLPTCSETDGRFISLPADGGMSSFANVVQSVEFAVPEDADEFEINIFDGDSGRDDSGAINLWMGNWDSTESQLKYTLYADPYTDGSELHLIGEWLGNTSNPTTGVGWSSSAADMPNNDWWSLVVQTSEEARAPSGNFFYRLDASFESSTPSIGISAYKVSTDNYLYFNRTTFAFAGIISTELDLPIIFPGWTGCWDASCFPNTTYDGSYLFYLDKFVSSENFVVWDGEFDHGSSTIEGDSDDPDTPNDELPPWAVPSGAALENAKHRGVPADDWPSAPFFRAPDVYYSLEVPDFGSYLNPNPSGNSEWEQFRLDTDMAVLADYYSDELFPGGIYELNIVGLDMVNTSFFHSNYRILGQTPSGDPSGILRPYIIGNYVWFDSDQDGVMDPEERGVAGVKLNLYDSNGNYIESAYSDARGYYEFEVEALGYSPDSSDITFDGIYSVEIDPENYGDGPLDDLPLTTESERLTFQVIDENVLDYNFGYFLPVLPETGIGIVGYCCIGVFLVGFVVILQRRSSMGLL